MECVQETFSQRHCIIVNLVLYQSTLVRTIQPIYFIVKSERVT